MARRFLGARSQVAQAGQAIDTRYLGCSADRPKNRRRAKEQPRKNVRPPPGRSTRQRQKNHSTRAGFEPTHGNRSRFLVCRLNHSATSPLDEYNLHGFVTLTTCLLSGIVAAARTIVQVAPNSAAGLVTPNKWRQGGHAAPRLLAAAAAAPTIR